MDLFENWFEGRGVAPKHFLFRHIVGTWASLGQQIINLSNRFVYAYLLQNKMLEVEMHENLYL